MPRFRFIWPPYGKTKVMAENGVDAERAASASPTFDGTKIASPDNETIAR